MPMGVCWLTAWLDFSKARDAGPSRESRTEIEHTRAYASTVALAGEDGDETLSPPVRLPQTMFAPNLHRMGERQSRWVSRKSLAALLCSTQKTILFQTCDPLA